MSLRDRILPLVSALRERTVAAIAAAYLAVAFVLPSGGIRGFEWCPLLRIASVPCPLCGLTRSLGALLHADPLAAWDWNPLGFLALPILLGAVATACVDDRRRTDFVRLLASRASGIRIALFGALMLALLFGLARAVAVASGWTSFPSGGTG